MDNYILIKFEVDQDFNRDFENRIYNFDNIGFSVDDPKEKQEILASLPEWEVNGLDIKDSDRVVYEVYFEDSDKGRQDMENLIDHLQGQIEDFSYEYKLVDNSNWEDEWKKSYTSFGIGEKILIKPSWEEVEAGGKIVIEIEPKMAFGTGTHETTSMCMEYVEDEDLTGKRVLDIGCGSGILSILAKKLGASQVDACDIDPIAIDSTLDNAQINGVEINSFESNLFSNVSGKYDLIFANILAEILVRMIEETDPYLTQDGLLVLSGIIYEKEQMVTDCLEANGYQVIDLVRKGEWSLVAARRSHV